MNQNFKLIGDFLAVARIISAYDPNPKHKSLFHSRGKALCKKIAKDLGYFEGEYDITSNKAGPSVVGEITLHTDNLYLQFSKLTGCSDNDILYRSCCGRKDFTGGKNNFFPLLCLSDYETFLDQLRHV